MSEFRGLRVTHQYTQTNQAPPDRVFPLLCPVREADWVPGWKYRLIYSQSGVAELGCVFTTPNEDGTECTWLCTEYDPASFRIAYAWITPGLIACQLRIQLEAGPGSTTRAHIAYTYTGLSPAGNKEVEHFTADWFCTKMQGWESAINHYLRTGKIIAGPQWE
ncbi:MAG: SRPBCC family protein [Chlamydiota bacterium]